jgi:DNA-directed RNA polymerase II subunit RPB1
LAKKKKAEKNLFLFFFTFFVPDLYPNIMDEATMVASVTDPTFWSGSKMDKPPLKPIKNIQLTVLDQTAIRKMSVCPVTTTTLYEKSLPRPFGINDIRMGTVDRKLRCGTCMNGIVACNGHYGHIELAVPVYHIMYIPYVLKILRCICGYCYRLILPTTDATLGLLLRKYKNSPKARFHAIYSHLKNKKQCGHDDCGFYLPKYSQVSLGIKREWLHNARLQFQEGPRKKKARGTAPPLKFTAEEREEHLLPLTCAIAKHTLEMVERDIYDLLGFNQQGLHPRNFIIETLVVPPPIIRPSISFSESSRTRGQDDLTHKLQEVLKTSNKLAKLSEATPAARQSLIVDLQVLVATYINNECSGVKIPLKKRSGLPEKCVVQRWRGKKGRVRGNLMGKRVDFSARTVISPDCVMDVDEIGIPFAIARKLTFRETVNSLNIHELTEKVQRGHLPLNGAKSVIESTGKQTQLEFCKNLQSIRLQLGWQVERYMKNGDYVLFNRQPSLRKKSIMAHKVRLMPGKTFRLNLSCTGPYNGDFDGDEMNAHFLQDYAATAEARELMAVEKQILNAQNNKPVMGIVQDALVGSYLLTSKNRFLTKAEVMQLLMVIKYPKQEVTTLPIPAILKPFPLWTGKQVFSALIPEVSLRFFKDSKAGVLDDELDVLIDSGQLLLGRMTKKMLGASSGGLIHVCCKLVGTRKTLEFMSDCQRMINLWMEGIGFSVGISDCLVSTNVAKKIQEAVDGCVAHVDNLNNVGKELNIDFHKREVHASTMLSKMMDVTGGMVRKDLSADDNALTAMVVAGSKGNPINISQIMGCVGQQSIEGHRIYDVRNPVDRTLSCFPKLADSAQSRGFVKNSYIQGLNAKEMFFHTMGGREGIVDTSVKTADTGYLQRRIMKALEMYTVDYDQTVRDTAGNILDFVYGGDNCDAQYLEKVNLYWLEFSQDDLRRNFSPDLLGTIEFDRTKSLIVKCVDAKLTLLEPRLSTTAYLPINIPLHLAQFKRTGPGSASAEFIYQHVSGFIEFLAGHDDYHTLYLRTSVAFHLRTNSIMENHSFTSDTFGKFIDRLSKAYLKTAVDAGESVGVLAAESVGHPCTQLTLNTFHFAGIAEKNVTLGVPRIKELIDARKKIKGPCTYVHLKSSVAGNKNLVKVLKERLVYTTLADMVKSTEIVYEPFLTETKNPEDVFVVSMQKFGQEADYPGYAHFVIRIVLEKRLLLQKELNIENVRDVIREHLGIGTHYIMQVSEVNMLNWVVRIRMCAIGPMRNKLKSVEDQADFEKNLAHLFLDYLCSEIRLCGVSGIEGAVYDEENFTRWDKETLAQSNDSQYMIMTQGVNLRGIWRQTLVAWDRTVSNDLFETAEVLGIETVAIMLFHEIRKVLSFDGSYVNDRHIMLIVNTMTRNGTLMGMNRHGLNKLSGTGPLVKSTFEQTVDIFFESAAFGEHNPINSVSDNIMCGQRIPHGTGKPAMVIDPKYLENIRKKKAEKGKSEKRFKVARTYYSDYLTGPTLPYPESPTYTPSSPSYTPTSPSYVPKSPTYTPSSPSYTPTSPSYVPKSPTYTPSSPPYTPTSPSYVPKSPTYTPSSPSYVPKRPTYMPISPLILPRSPTSPSRTVPSPLMIDDEKKKIGYFQDSIASFRNPSSTMHKTVFAFMKRNNIGFSYDKYTPSSPKLKKKYTAYRPSSPEVWVGRRAHVDSFDKNNTDSVDGDLGLIDSIYNADTGELDFDILECILKKC